MFRSQFRRMFEILKTSKQDIIDFDQNYEDMGSAILSKSYGEKPDIKGVRISDIYADFLLENTSVQMRGICDSIRLMMKFPVATASTERLHRGEHLNRDPIRNRMQDTKLSNIVLIKEDRS